MQYFFWGWVFHTTLLKRVLHLLWGSEAESSDSGRFPAWMHSARYYCLHDYLRIYKYIYNITWKKLRFITQRAQRTRWNQPLPTRSLRNLCWLTFCEMPDSCVWAVHMGMFDFGRGMLDLTPRPSSREPCLPAGHLYHLNLLCCNAFPPQIK